MPCCLGNIMIPRFGRRIFRKALANIARLRLGGMFSHRHHQIGARREMVEKSATADISLIGDALQSCTPISELTQTLNGGFNQLLAHGGCALGMRSARP